MKTLIRLSENIFEDGLFPSSGGLSGIDNIPDKRHEALIEVLCRIPKRDYNTLKDLIDTFEYFIPHVRSRGEVYPFPITVDSQTIQGTPLRFKPYAKVLFLSPLLEETDFDIVLAVTAHELAHIVLQHNVHSRGDEYRTQEDEAWNLIRKWNFEEEYKKHQLEQKQGT